MGNAWLEDPDVRLMLDVKEDRPGAFEALVARFAPVLVNFTWRHTGRLEDAEDLAQEVFAKVFRARHRYQPAARFRTWILTVATNVCLNRQRYDRYRAHVSLDAPAGSGPDGRPREVEDPQAVAPFADLERGEIQQKVRQAVLRLPENQRLAVSLLRFEERSYREIASVMGLSVPAVKSLLNRAKENLRGLLAREIEDHLAGRGTPVAGSVEDAT